MSTEYCDPYLCLKFVSKLHLTPLLLCRSRRGLRLGHLDVLIFDGILAPSLFRILVEFDTPTRSAREAIHRRESLSVCSASDVWLNFTTGVRVRFLNNYLAGLFIRSEMSRVLSVLGLTTTSCIYRKYSRFGSFPETTT